MEQHLMFRRRTAPIQSQHCQQPLPYPGQERPRLQHCFLQQLRGALRFLHSSALVQAVMHLSGGQIPELLQS